MKAIDTEYKGYLFRSRLEARWAVFFDACGIDWEYEPEGYVLPNGQWYLPDFLLHGGAGRTPKDLYVEVKGVMTEDDAEKIRQFSGYSRGTDNGTLFIENPILVVSGIPDCGNIDDVTDFCEQWGYSGFPGFRRGPFPFNFETIDGDYFTAHPGINKDGVFELFGDDSSYLADRDDHATLMAYRKARQARFEYGESGGYENA